jgi:hypothetical protein
LEEIKSEEELDKVPMLRTPAETYVWAVAGILGIAAFAAAMMYAWSLVL